MRDILFLLLFVSQFAAAASYAAAPAGGQITVSDGFKLDYVIDYPAAGKNISKVVILIHGSGPQNMDEDMTQASNGVKNLFFVDLSSALTKEGFTVIRYNKRSFQIAEDAKTNTMYLRSESYKNFAANPLKYFVDDAVDAIKFVSKKFPGYGIDLIGHSQGTYVALQAAAVSPSVKTVGLIGFTNQGMETTVFEQTVYRPMYIFDALDINRDNALDAKELEGGDAVSVSLRKQLAVIDVNENGKMDRAEFTAGNLSNILSGAMGDMSVFKKQEAEYKTASEIIKNAAFDICFFQGELDNQTPSYNAKAIDILNRLAWKKDNLHFKYFNGLGHALDRRANYSDLVFKPADKGALADVAGEMSKY